MTILALGRSWSGQPLFPACDEDSFADALLAALRRNVDAVRSAADALVGRTCERGEVQRRVLDAGDPRAAGWTFLVRDDDPDRDALIAAIRPLAEARGMPYPDRPLVFHGEAPIDWLDWLHDHFYARGVRGGVTPRYVLILGGPDRVPFAFQSLLHTVASVGRLDVEKVEDVAVYVDKVLRLEGADQPAVEREVVMFAPDDGPGDATYFSRRYMAQPMSRHLASPLGFRVIDLEGELATKGNLDAALTGHRPALVYTASHGLGALDQPLDVQRRLNGAICCHGDGADPQDSLFAADDVPMDRPFLEGAVFFQFACFGYGTPAESEHAHWVSGAPRSNADADFVAALPRRLLAHPRGPIAYVGHVDAAFLHAFADPRDPHSDEHWSHRIAPFKSAVEHLLGVQPSGLAMTQMNDRFAATSAVLSHLHDAQQRRTGPATRTQRRRLIDHWILRADAQNYMVLGDPAARLRIPA